jgi:hypothetical protein
VPNFAIFSLAPRNGGGIARESGADIDMRDWKEINEAFARVDSLLKGYRRGLCDGSAKPTEQTVLIKEELRSALSEARRAVEEHWSAVISEHGEKSPQDYAEEEARALLNHARGLTEQPKITHPQLDGLAEANRRLAEQVSRSNRVKI